MNKKSIQIIAIVGLVFTVVFSVFLVMTLIDETLFNGNITTVTIAVGAFALVLFAVVYLYKRNERKSEELQKQQEEEDRLAALKEETPPDESGNTEGGQTPPG